MLQTQRLFLPDKDFPLSLRTLFTATLIVLGIGYLFAMINIYNTHAGRDGRPGLSTQDIAIAYSGSKEATKLEGALMGPMSGMLPAEERAAITTWIHRGLDKREYDTQIGPLLEKRCVACHDGSNPHIPSLVEYEEVLHTTELDTGMGFSTLIRVSHIHMFGMTFIFFVMGVIFSNASMKRLWLKSAIIAVPFIGIILDIFSWYLTKLNTGFAWVVIGGGAIMGACFAFQAAISLYQMWLSRFFTRLRLHEPTTVRPPPGPVKP